jgi:hypothetical protein
MIPDGEPPELSEDFTEALEVLEPTTSLLWKEVRGIWQRARIEFEVRRVERCTFTPEDLAYGYDGKDVKVPPLRSPETRERDFRRGQSFGVRFNTPGFRGINVYVWPSIKHNWGFSLSTCFSGGGTLWLDAAAIALTKDDLEESKDQGRVVAHEIGHVLGLRHWCTANSPESDSRDCEIAGDNGLCDRLCVLKRLPGCSLLMADNEEKCFRGRELEESEIRRARGVVVLRMLRPDRVSSSERDGAAHRRAPSPLSAQSPR